MTKPAPHVNEEKKKQVAHALKLIQDNPIIGIVNLESLPVKQLQQMKEQLRGKVTLFTTKKRLLRIAFAEASKSKKGLEELSKRMKGMPALLVTKDNPFALYKTIKKSKSPAPAKAGQTAPKDIIVPAGPTNFAPGPVIAELGGVGIKAGIENNKVVIKADSTVAKEGDTISEQLAALLQRLDINPMEIGLDVVAVYEDGTIYGRDVLDVDEEQFMSDLMRIAQEGINLAVDIGWPTKDTITLMLQKAHRNSTALAQEQDILTSDNVDSMLAKAEAQATALHNKTN